MCDQNNLKDQLITNLKFKGLTYNQNNLKNQYLINLNDLHAVI